MTDNEIAALIMCVTALISFVVVFGCSALYWRLKSR